MKLIPKEYQLSQFKKIAEEFNNGNKSLLVQDQTGTGKGFMASYLISRWHLRLRDVMHEEDNKNRDIAWFIVNGRSVVTDFRERLKDICPECICRKSDNICPECGFPHNGIPAVYMMNASGETFDLGINTQVKIKVISIQSLNSWFFKSGSRYPLSALALPKYIINDEARTLTSTTCQNIYSYIKEKCPDVKIIGLDATPDNKNLGLIYDKLIVGKGSEYHINNGNLCPVSVYLPSKRDTDTARKINGYLRELTDVGKRKADYSDEDNDKLLNNKVVIGDIVDNYKRISMIEYGKLESAIVACASKIHAKALQQSFIENDIPAVYVDCDTKTPDREEIFKRVRKGEPLVICQIATLTYGVDMPPLKIAIMARKTKKASVFLQFVGRVKRTSEGKTHAVLIDHVNVVDDIGHPDDEYDWELVGKPTNKTREAMNDDVSRSDYEIPCRSCGFMMRNQTTCPRCQTEHISAAETSDVIYFNAELEKVERISQMQEAKETARLELAVQLAHHFKDINKVNDILRFKKYNAMTTYEYDDISKTIPVPISEETAKILKNRKIHSGIINSYKHKKMKRK